VLVTAIFGAFVSILDTTIVNTALPHIQRAFGSDLHVASYVTTAYTLAQGVIMAASGFLANRFGIKRMYLLSLALFTLGSVLCGIAWNINILILFRVLQGASGAALFPLSLSLLPLAPFLTAIWLDTWTGAGFFMSTFPLASSGS